MDVKEYQGLTVGDRVLVSGNKSSGTVKYITDDLGIACHTSRWSAGVLRDDGVTGAGRDSLWRIAFVDGGMYWENGSSGKLEWVMSRNKKVTLKSGKDVKTTVVEPIWVMGKVPVIKKVIVVGCVEIPIAGALKQAEKTLRMLKNRSFVSKVTGITLKVDYKGHTLTIEAVENFIKFLKANKIKD